MALTDQIAKLAPSRPRKWSAAELAEAEVEVGLRPADDPDIPMFGRPEAIAQRGAAPLDQRLKVLADVVATVWLAGGLVALICDDPADLHKGAPDTFVTHGFWWWMWVVCWGPLVVAIAAAVLVGAIMFLRYMATGKRL